MGSLFLSPEEAADIRELISQTKEANARAAEAAKNDGWTKEKIMAVKDQGKRQALINEHLDLFKGQVHGKR